MGFRNFIDNWRAHPFQNIASTAIGLAGGPLAGQAARMGFNRFNSGQFNNGVVPNAGSNTALAGAVAGNQAMQQPLGGMLSGNNDLGAGYNSPSGNMTGYAGAPGDRGAGSGGYNMAQQYGQQHSPLAGLLDFLGSQQGQQQFQTPQSTMQNNSLYQPNFTGAGQQSQQSPLSGLLDFLGPVAQQNGGGPHGGAGGFMGANGGGNNGEWSMGQGANGETFISGGNGRWDPNQGVMANRYHY